MYMSWNGIHFRLWKPVDSWLAWRAINAPYRTHGIGTKRRDLTDAAETHRYCTCVDTDAANSLAERYTTVDEYLRAGRFDPKVFVNCMLTIIYHQLCIAQEGKLQYETRS